MKQFSQLLPAIDAAAYCNFWHFALVIIKTNAFSVTFFYRISEIFSVL